VKRVRFVLAVLLGALLLLGSLVALTCVQHEPGWTGKPGMRLAP
jgi:hypothetical protein